MPNLYVTEPGARLETEAGQLLVTKHGELLLAVPAARVDEVVLVGHAGVTTPALGLLLDRGIGLVLLTTGGRFRGRLVANRAVPVDLRRAQYRRAEDPAFCLALSRAIAAGKIRNARTLLLRLDETNTDPPTLAAVREMAALEDALPAAETLAAIMGIEGRAARRTFAVLGRALRPPWVLPRRARRPPPDPVNALLSLLYTLLHESCYAAVEAVGLDPYCGYLHQPRAGRAALALDLMEEFRPVIADSVMLTLLNKRILSPDDFEPGDPADGVRLTREGWRHVATQYTKRLQTRIRPPGLARQTTYQKLLEIQARGLKRAIVEDVPYVPFRAK
ncbi:MAG: CRISPR-associated endonuclease Cas1 [Thermomicrobiales bacterium]